MQEYRLSKQPGIDLTAEDMLDCLPQDLSKIDTHDVLERMELRRREKAGDMLSTDELARVRANRNERGREGERARALDVLVIATRLEMGLDNNVLRETLAGGCTPEEAIERFYLWDLQMYDGTEKTWRAHANIRHEFSGDIETFKAYSSRIRTEEGKAEFYSRARRAI